MYCFENILLLNLAIDNLIHIFHLILKCFSTCIAEQRSSCVAYEANTCNAVFSIRAC